MNKPNFFILGAPRCGTTSLFEYLSEHPRVFVPAVKEPHFFNTDHAYHGLPISSPYKVVPTASQYNDLFKDASEHHLAVGEASADYLYSKVAVVNILHYNPNARFIVMLRSPVEMVRSYHIQMIFWRWEDVLNLEEAWRLEDERKRGARVPRGLEPACFYYSEVCALGSQLERLYQTVSRDRVLVNIFDDLTATPKEVYRRTLEFLELPPHDQIRFDRHNPGQAYRSPLVQRMVDAAYWSRVRVLGPTRSLRIGKILLRLNSKPAKPGPLRPAFLQELTEHFEPEVKKMAELTGRDLSAWTNVPDASALPASQSSIEEAMVR